MPWPRQLSPEKIERINNFADMLLLSESAARDSRWAMGLSGLAMLREKRIKRVIPTLLDTKSLNEYADCLLGAETFAKRLLGK